MYTKLLLFLIYCMDLCVFACVYTVHSAHNVQYTGRKTSLVFLVYTAELCSPDTARRCHQSDGSSAGSG